MYNLTRRWKGAQSGRRVHWLSLCTTALLMLSDLVIAQEVDISQDLVQSYCSSENTADVDSCTYNAAHEWFQRLTKGSGIELSDPWTLQNYL